MPSRHDVAIIQDVAEPDADRRGVGGVGGGGASRPVLKRIEAVVNAASGSVGPDGAERLSAMLERFGPDAHVANAQPADIEAAVKAAVAAKPDLLIVLAGDGTAGLAARLCGPDGPLVAPLPGGTMNMLPHALYGRVSWPEALEATLSSGVVRPVSGGEVDGRTFYVAAILGAPALWAKAREALRHGKLRQAWLRAQHALRQAFAGRLRYALEDGPRSKTEALTLMCPLVSRACDDDTALEAAALNVHHAGEAFRLGFNMLTGDWRRDPSVTVQRCCHGRAWAKGHMPAILDGEPVRLNRVAEIRFRPVAFRALAPPASGSTAGE